MDMVRERELNVPIFQKQKSYQAQTVRRKYIKPPFEKRISPISKGWRRLSNLKLSYNNFSNSISNFSFKPFNSILEGRLSSLYIFSIGYHQTGPFPLLP